MSNQSNALTRSPQFPLTGQSLSAAEIAAQRQALADRIDAQLAREEAEQAWTNPGTTPQEIAFFAKKRAAWVASQGRESAQPAPANVQWFKPVAASLGNIATKPRELRNRTPRPRRGYRHHSGNVYYCEGQHRTKLDRNQVAKLLRVAEDLERRTKAKGRFNGVISKAGLDVLRALLCHFYNHKNGGQCDPSFDALQRVTGYCRQTIADALERLEATGLVQRVRRLIRVMITTRCPVTGNPVQCPATQQTSNAYLFKVLDTPAGTKPADFHRGGGFAKTLFSLLNLAESAPQTESTRNTKKEEDREKNSRAPLPWASSHNGMPPKGAA